MLNKSVNGFLLIDKPESWSSFDVCKKCRSICGTKKVGHSGTLDPFATGLLIVAVGEATKLLNFVPGEPKEYVATLSLGKKTDTADCTGNVIETKKVPDVTEEDIEKVFESLLGEQDQIPPMTSAVHVNGVKLYKLAHQGIEIERKPRKINVFSLKLMSYSNNEITFKCSVSAGTYVRTLGETIAEKLSTVGYLKSLRRTSIGSVSVNYSKKIEDITVEDIKPINDVLCLPTLLVEGKNLELVSHGSPIEFNGDSKYILIIDVNNNPLAIYEKKDVKIYVSARGLNI